MISLSIDVDKIDKTRFTTFKGKRYLNLVLIESPEKKYGNDYFVTYSRTKEETEAGVKNLPIIGNARVIGTGPRKTAASKPQPAEDPW